MLGIAAIIVCVVLAFKTARDYGRNPFLWAVITFSVGFGIQYVLTFVVGLVLGVVWMLGGSTQEQIQMAIQGPAFFITIGATILSVIAMIVVLKYLSRVREGVDIPASKKAGSLGLDD